jgi:hypothetical protein
MADKHTGTCFCGAVEVEAAGLRGIEGQLTATRSSTGFVVRADAR